MNTIWGYLLFLVDEYFGHFAIFVALFCDLIFQILINLIHCHHIAQHYRTRPKRWFQITTLEVNTYTY